MAMKWKVTTLNDTVEIEAHRAIIADSGVLCFCDNKEQIERAFAPGAWQECVLVERESVGYKR